MTITVARFDDQSISISHQKATAILRKMGMTVAEFKRGNCNEHSEHGLFGTGAKIKFSPYAGYYIRTYGCEVTF